MSFQNWGVPIVFVILRLDMRGQRREFMCEEVPVPLRDSGCRWRLVEAGRNLSAARWSAFEKDLAKNTNQAECQKGPHPILHEIKLMDKELRNWEATDFPCGYRVKKAVEQTILPGLKEEVDGGKTRAGDEVKERLNEALSSLEDMLSRLRASMLEN
jgi:hypothetical protein